MIVLRVLVAASLAGNAYLHLWLAPQWDSLSHGIGGGNLFRIEGAVAALVAIIVVVAGRGRAVYGLAFVVNTAALGALLLYRYVDVGDLGPIPNLYEPVWFTEKIITVVVEAIGALAALIAFAIAPSKPPARQ